MFVAVVAPVIDSSFWHQGQLVLNYQNTSVPVLSKRFLDWANENKIAPFLIDRNFDQNFMTWMQKNGRFTYPIYSGKTSVEEQINKIGPDVVLNLDTPSIGSTEHRVINLRNVASPNFTNEFFKTMYLSSSTSAFFHDTFPVSTSAILPPAIDTSQYYPFHYVQKDHNRKKFGLDGKFVVGTISRDINYALLFAAWRAVEKTCQNAVLFVVNKIDKNNIHLPSLAQNFGLNKVVFPEFVRNEIDIIEHYNSMDLLVYPSAPKSCQSILEAMSTNVPVSVLDTPISRSVCRDNALYIPPTDFEVTRDCIIPITNAATLADFLIKTINGGKDLKDLGEKGRVRALQYDRDVSFEQWRKVLYKTRRRVTPMLDVEKVAMICPSLGTVCGIGDYTERLISEVKKFCKVFPYRDYNQETVERIKQNGIKVVVLQFEYALFQKDQLAYFLRQLRENNIVSIVSLHSFMRVHDTYTPILNFADYLLAHSKFLYESLAEQLGKDRVGYIAMGVDDENLQNDTAAIRKTLGIPQDAKVIAGFGFFEQHKDFGMTARITKELLDRGHDVYFLLASFAKDNPIAKAAEQQFYSLLSQLGLEKRFVRVGQRNYLSRTEIRKYLSVANAILFTYPELFTNSASASIRDAMPAGSPIVATDITFFDGLDCIPKGRTQAEMAAICEKIFVDNEYRKKIVEDIQKFRTENTWTNTAKQYYDFIVSKK